MPVHTESDGKGGLQAKAAQATTQDKSAKDKISDSAHHAAHKANPGPVIAQNLPPAASKEELKKRQEELNKD